MFIYIFIRYGIYLQQLVSVFSIKDKIEKKIMLIANQLKMMFIKKLPIHNINQGNDHLKRIIIHIFCFIHGIRAHF